MFRERLLQLLETCKDAVRRGHCTGYIKQHILRFEIESFLRDVSARDFMKWVADDREYSCYYYDAQQHGVCAKPDEAAAFILEEIVSDALDSD
jgi:hypothetical protein